MDKTTDDRDLMIALRPRKYFLYDDIKECEKKGRQIKISSTDQQKRDSIKVGRK